MFQKNQTNKEKEDSNSQRGGKGSVMTNLNPEMIREYFGKYLKGNSRKMYKFLHIHMTY